jgi:hypothetical protein
METKKLLLSVTTIFVVGCGQHHVDNTPQQTSLENAVKKTPDVKDKVSNPPSLAKLEFFEFGKKDPIELSSKALNNFVQIISFQPRTVAKGSLNPPPLGSFKLGNKVYFWEGTVVVYEENDTRSIWTDPRIQKMTQALADRNYRFSPEILNFLEESEH